MIRITAFRWVPPFAQGVVKDLRPRWALEEAEIPYEIELIGRDEQNSDSYRKRQPFGQVPVLEDGELSLFESGAIALYVAKHSPVLLPENSAAKERAQVWVFAALNSIEPYVQNLGDIDLFNKDKSWAAERRPEVLDMLKQRLQKLDQWMNGREYLEENSFTIGDLMMVSVLRNLHQIDLLAKDFPKLGAYVKRCESRPAFQKALAGQMKAFADHAPA